MLPILPVRRGSKLDVLGSMNVDWKDEALQHARLAKQFLEAAQLVSDGQRKLGSLLFIPALAMTGHGLELMLKAACYLNRVKPPTRGPHGHKINALWHLDACRPLRLTTASNAVGSAEAYAASTGRSDVPTDPAVLIEEYVLALGALHGGQGYPLRYPVEDRMAPRTPFLVQTLRATADDLLKRPSSFELASFPDDGV